MSRRLRFTAAQQSQMIAGAVASGRIPPGQAGRYAAEVAAGGTRGGRAIADLLQRWGPGHPIGQRAAVSAASAEDTLWSQMGYGDRKPAPSDAEPWRSTLPLTMGHYRDVYPDTPRVVDTPPPIPSLSGYVPTSAQLSIPAEVAPAPAPAGIGSDGQPVSLASAPVYPARPRRPARAADTPGQVGQIAMTTHGALSTVHTHEHTDQAGATHDHVHTHRNDADHSAGAGHDHVEIWQPELASRGQRRPSGGPRPFTMRTNARTAAAAAASAEALAAAAASPARRVRWPGS